MIQSGLQQFVAEFEKPHPYLNTKQRFYKMRMGSIYMNKLQQLYLNALNNWPYAITYSADDKVQNELKLIYQETANMFYKTQSLIWSMKNAGFMERFFNFKLPLLGLLTNMHLWAKMGIVRRKGKDCIEDDSLYTATLYNQCMSQRLYY